MPGPTPAFAPATVPLVSWHPRVSTTPSGTSSKLGLFVNLVCETQVVSQTVEKKALTPLAWSRSCLV